MSSQVEGRICLALQAYTSHQLPSLQAAANAYDVPFATLHERHLGVLPRSRTLANSGTLNNNEETALVHKILKLSAEEFPPQRKFVEDWAITMLSTQNPSHYRKIGKGYQLRQYVLAYTELAQIDTHKIRYFL